MKLLNHTPYTAGYSTGLLPNRQYCVVVVVKASFAIPRQPDGTVELATPQEPLYETDGYWGEPGYSSPQYENDYATRKPLCDVLISGQAVVTDANPVEQLVVSAQVGSLSKQFRVTGERYWQKQLFRYKPSEPEPFQQHPLRWETAYGGTLPDPEQAGYTLGCWASNPIGTGFLLKGQEPTALDQLPLARTEALDDPIQTPYQTCQPQGFGPIARHWQPRLQYAGTYDADWIKNRKPFLPDDFDERYYQCAPADQQIPHLQGGESVWLVNLSPWGELRFRIPRLHPPVSVWLRNGGKKDLLLCVDTLHINTFKHTFMLTARTHIPFIHSIHEISRIIIGTPPDPAPTAVQPVEDDK